MDIKKYSRSKYVTEYAIDCISVQQGQAGTTLIDASVSVQPHYTRTYLWDISKSVIPTEWNLFKGDTGISQYTITVVKDGFTDVAYLDGQVCVTNGGAEATENLAIVVDVTMPPSSTVIASANVDVTSNPVLDSGETGCYNYSVTIPTASIVPGATYKVTAHITITNHSGHLGVPFGPDPSNTTVLPSSPTLINDIIHVTDNGRSYTFSSSGQVSYTVNYSCPDDAGTHENIAKIVETGQSSSTSVTVNCYALKVSKSANATLTRTYNWNVSKVADQSNITLALGQTLLVNYNISVNAAAVDSEWTAYGDINVYNPAPIPVTINSISDIIAPNILATVTCPISFPYTLAAGDTLICNYSALLPDGIDRTNTATVTIQNYTYDSSGGSMTSGTTDFSGTASISFADAIINEVNKCVNVVDTLGGFLGSVCAGIDPLPKEFSYSAQIGPYSVCGNYLVTNIAEVRSNSTVLATASWTVNVNAACAGCTRTIGYWKTHPSQIAKYLPISLGSFQVNTLQQAIDVLNQDVYGTPLNGITKLYAQLLAAKLNIASGANASVVQSTIKAADAFLSVYNYNDWFTNLTKTQRQMVLGWVTTLDNYNNGLIGPGHCTF